MIFSRRVLSGSIVEMELSRMLSVNVGSSGGGSTEGDLADVSIAR